MRVCVCVCVFRMDVGALAGGGGVPRRADSAEVGLEIVPLEMYDSARAKIEANLRWLFAKAYGEGKWPFQCHDIHRFLQDAPKP